MNSYTMILVFYSYIKCYFNSNMKKSTLKISKSDSPSPLSIDHGMFKSYSILSRCNSFSSCSNDSADYCGSQSTQTRIKNGKRMPSDKQPADLPKRSRNSSGSSISSNMSYISDKELRSNRVLSTTSAKSTSKNNSVNVSLSLKHSAESNNVELKDATTKNERVPSAKDSLIIPNTRTLRGKITRKGCACCPSTRTTVVVRRYHEIVKTTEKKTVISSTKVKTYVQKQSAPSTIQTNTESNKSSQSSSNSRKKRRSEIEKLYESLHEIEWAKNFSPDNILRQINIRQAASCSVFGRSHTNTEDSEQKVSKRQKTMNDIANKGRAPINKTLKSANEASKRISNCEIKPCTNGRSCRSKTKVTDVQTENISSNSCQYEPSYKSCNSQSSVNISCSVSHINVKEINIKSTESLNHTNSLVTVNGGDDYCDDAQLSYTSDESSSAVSSSIVNIQSKHLLDLDYKDRSNRDLSDTNMSEYSATPTFFDIAEEGIRTIDACFREVGAEVVVSTCYDESSLPSLTSVGDSSAANKALDDGPPVLEPCVDVTSNQNMNKICNGNSLSKIRRKNKYVKNCSIESTTQNYDKYDSASLKSDGDDVKTDVESEAHKKCYSFLIYRSNRDLLLLKAGKRISNKYFRWLSKSRLKLASKIELNETTAKNENISKRSGRHYVNIKSCSETKDTNLLNHYQGSSLPSTVSLISHKVHPKTVDDQSKKITVNETTTEMCSKRKLRNGLMFGCSKSGSSLYNAVVKHSNEKPSVIHKVQSSVTVQKSVISSFVASKGTSDKIIKEPIGRPLPSVGFSSHYNSIRVNRSNNYTQVILKLTRGTSIFLTLEALTELTDALNRTTNDTGCQILILNGIGDSFCLGLDLKPLVGPEKFTATKEMAVAIKELIEALSRFKKPLAAVVNGPALGLGMTLLNHADFTLASDKATFCMPHSYLGYMPEGGATLTLPQIVGSTVAMDLLIRGKTLTAREACNVGLVSEVLEAKRLPQELVSRVKMMAGNSLQALETTKSLLKMELHVNLQLVLQNEVALLPRMWLTDTCQNALRKALHSGILSE